MQTVDVTGLVWFARRWDRTSQDWAIMVQDVEPSENHRYMVARSLEQVAAEHIVRLHNRHIQGSIYWDEDEDD